MGDFAINVIMFIMKIIGLCGIAIYAVILLIILLKTKVISWIKKS